MERNVLTKNRFNILLIIVVCDDEIVQQRFPRYSKNPYSTNVQLSECDNFNEIHFAYNVMLRGRALHIFLCFFSLFSMMIELLNDTRRPIPCDKIENELFESVHA